MAKQRQSCGHSLDVGQALGLAGGGTDKYIPQRVVAGHLGRRDGPYENHAVSHAEALRLLFQHGALWAVADDEQNGARQILHRIDKFCCVFFLGQPSQAEQDGLVCLFRRQAQAAAQGIIPGHSKALQVQPRGDDTHRAVHAVARQQAADLGRGSDDCVAVGADHAGEQRRHLAPHAAAGGKVVGVIFVHRVIGVDKRCARSVRNPACRGKSAELALRVDNIRVPVDQITDGTIQCRGAHPGSGVDQPGIQ